MKKLANIDTFECLQMQADSQLHSDVAVFNKSDPAVIDLCRQQIQSRLPRMFDRIQSEADFTGFLASCIAQLLYSEIWRYCHDIAEQLPEMLGKYKDSFGGYNVDGRTLYKAVMKNSDVNLPRKWR